MSKIFVVDDDHAILKLYRLMLSGVGFEILDTATNGKIAVEKYKQFPVKPDLILIDYRMPIKNGLDAMVEILQMNSTEKIVFASADMDIKKKALELGAREFISKPFGLDDVVRVLNNVLNPIIAR